MNITIDPIQCWKSLTPDQQQLLGSAAIVHTLGLAGVLSAQEPYQTYVAADFEGFEVMTKILEEGLGEYELRINTPRPDLTVLGIAVCRVCGCTDRCGCKDGCHWVEKDLCSTCGNFVIGINRIVSYQPRAVIGGENGNCN